MYSRLWGHPLEYGQSTRRSTPLKKTDPFPLWFHQPSIPPQLRAGLRNTFSLHARLLIDWPCADLLQETSAAMNLCVKWSFDIWKTLFCSTQSKSLALIIFLALELWGEGIIWLYLLWLSTSLTFIPYTLTSCKVSALTILHCTKKLLQWDLRTAVIYGKKDMCLEGSLTLYSMNKMAVICSPMGVCELHNHWFLTWFTAIY